MEVKVYNQEGKETGKLKLSERIFDLPWNGDLVHQVLSTLDGNARVNVAHVKDRSEVRGGGKKPWRQKGTGRARHGSIRSPIWVGGGITHGPRKEENYKKKVNKKMKTKALLTALSAKLRDGEIIFVDAITFDEPKTKKAKDILLAIGKVFDGNSILSKKKNSMKVFILGQDEKLSKSFQNFKNIDVSNLESMNVRSVLSHKYLAITNPKESIAFLEKKTASSKEKVK